MNDAELKRIADWLRDMETDAEWWRLCQRLLRALKDGNRNAARWEAFQNLLITYPHERAIDVYHMVVNQTEGS